MLFIKITVWARRQPTEQNHTALALDIAMNALSYFASYFNITDPIPPKTGKYMGLNSILYYI